MNEKTSGEVSRRPRIGITADYTSDIKHGEMQDSFSLWDSYCAAIRKSGGLPIILPSLQEYDFIDEYLDLLDGILISGGQDIMPGCYGQEPLAGFNLEWQMEPRRDAFEIAVCKEALAREMPVFGICRGVQVMAVAGGGKLHQDIDIANGAPGANKHPIRHFQVSPWNLPSHTINIVPGSRLSSIVKENPIAINSLHHQAVCEIPDGYTISATAPDGITEAIELGGNSFALGVQWHPERMFDGDEISRALFAAFIEACS